MLPILLSLLSVALGTLLALAATSILGGRLRLYLLNLRGMVDGEAANLAKEAQHLDLDLANNLVKQGDPPRVLVDRWQSARSLLGVRQGSGRDWDFSERDLSKWRERETGRRSRERQDFHRVASGLVWCAALVLVLCSAMGSFLLLGSRYAG
jgi:hypothetical protein